jgi:hypothetical protein
MDRKKPLASAAAAPVVLALSVGGVAYATGDDSVQQTTGPNIERAKSAAVDYTNGGFVTGTEIGEEEDSYELEVTCDDDSQVDVHLERDIVVIGKLADYESPDGKDGPTTTDPASGSLAEEDDMLCSLEAPSQRVGRKHLPVTALLGIGLSRWRT